MTPAELITRKLKDRIEAAGASVPVVSLLLSAMVGERKAVPPSAISLNVHVAAQSFETLPTFTFDVVVGLAVALDDDAAGGLFRENYEAIWTAVASLALDENFKLLGDQDDETAEHVFTCNGVYLAGGSEPDYADDGNGGSWTVEFRAVVAGLIPDQEAVEDEDEQN